jgi:hypothetical protein
VKLCNEREKKKRGNVKETSKSRRRKNGRVRGKYRRQAREKNKI